MDSHFFAKLLLNLMDGSFVEYMAPVIYGQIQMGKTKFVVFYDFLICHSLSRDFQSLRAPSHPIHHLHKNKYNLYKNKNPSCYMFNGKYLFKVMCGWLIIFMFTRVFH